MMKGVVDAMKFIVSGKNIEVTDALRNKIIRKMKKLEKIFDNDTEAQITMSVEKSRHIVEVTVRSNGMVIRAEVSNDDMYASIDRAIDKLEGQIRKYKTKLAKKLREDVFFAEQIDDRAETENDRNDFKVVRSKRFAIKPMAVEEAILQMNLLGHEFFMFSNADTKEVNVVYRRKDGNYGLIEPEF
jgi:putative sigma-54 modulation protein